MTIEQTVEIPADYRIVLDLPRSLPAGKKAQIEITISDEIEDIRQLLQKEIAEKGTAAVESASGDGWEAHIREKYAES